MSNENLLSFCDLTRDEMNELRRQRFERRLASGNALNYETEPPWTPSEARWHASEFVRHNTAGNLVRMLAESFIALQDAVAANGRLP